MHTLIHTYIQVRDELTSCLLEDAEARVAVLHILSESGTFICMYACMYTYKAKLCYESGIWYVHVHVEHMYVFLHLYM